MTHKITTKTTTQQGKYLKNSTMQRPKIYVITGGPGTGKSAIINNLEIVFGEYVIREAATDYILFQQSRGNNTPWLEEDFQEHVTRLQMQRRNMIPDNISRVFTDRDVPDGLAFNDKNTDIYKSILEKAKRLTIDKVFLIEDLGFTETNKIRKEDHQEAMDIGNKLREVYRELGFEPISIPAGSVEERSRLILKYVNDLENYFRG